MNNLIRQLFKDTQAIAQAIIEQQRNGQVNPELMGKIEKIATIPEFVFLQMVLKEHKEKLKEIYNKECKTEEEKHLLREAELESMRTKKCFLCDSEVVTYPFGEGYSWETKCANPECDYLYDED